MIQAIQEFQIVFTGGFAFYSVTCILLVSAVGCYEIGKSLSKIIRK